MNQSSIFHLSSLSSAVISVKVACKQKTSFTASRMETKAGRVFPKEWHGLVNPSHTHAHTHISKGCSSTCPGYEPREAPVKSHGLYREVCKGSEEAMERKSLPLWGGHGEEEARQGQMLFSQRWGLAQIIMQIFSKQHRWEHESWHCKKI